MHLRVTPLLVYLLIFPLCLSSLGQQDTSSEDKAVAPRALEISDAADWESVRQFSLSPDGKWSAHFLMPGDGDGKLIVRKTDSPISKADDKAPEGEAEEKAEGEADAKTDEGKDEKKDEAKSDSKDVMEFVVGPGSGQIAFSHDSQFMAYRSAPKDKESKAAKKSGTPPKNKAILIELKTGKEVVFEKTQRFAFSEDNPDYFVVHKMKPKGRPSGDEGWDGTDLVVHNLNSSSQINIGNVKSFAFNDSGKFLALLIDAEGRSGNGLQLFHVSDARIESLENGDARYRSLSWTREGDALSFLRSKKDEDFEKPHHHLIAFSELGGANQQRIELDPVKHGAIPEEMTISSNRRLEWSDDRKMIFFGIHDMERKEDAKEKGESKSDDAKGEKKSGKGDDDSEVAELVIWHWEDKRLQSQQQVQESRDKNRFDLCVYHVDKDEVMRLGDDEIENVSVSRPHKFAIGTSDEKYRRFGNMEGTDLSDIYTIDLATGKRKLVLEGAQYVFDVSPNGNLLLYYKNEGHYFIYNMSKSTHTNVTKDVAAVFYDIEDDHNVVKPPRRPIDWTTDGDHILLSDGFDIWKVAADGSGGKNLTVDGNEKQIRYRFPFRFDPDVMGVDLSKPVYISTYGEWTKKSGFCRLSPGETGVEMLLWDDASFGGISKLEDHEIYTYSRGSHEDPDNNYVGGPDLKDAVQLTDSNRQQANFKWSSGVQLVDYQNSDGVKLQGALHLPADYIEGKKYPTIVLMYEKLSQTANRYGAPRTGGLSTSIYNSKGYAVFNPDIVFKVNDPGMSSVDCILAGLDAAIETGVVDPDRVGIHGHSWGGYQTAFMITQTDRFKAAVAGAPLTNMISMYSSIYWNSGSPNQPIFERSQGRFSSGYWDNLEAYARNSPVYHAKNVKTPLLLLHNDKDGAVDWNQGIEYFNTLRRLDKPVVMLQYKGENHGLRVPANRKDYSHRMLDFFDHHLKGEDAATWWSDGIKHLEMEDHIKDYKDSKSSDSDDEK